MQSNYYAVIMAGGIGSRFWPLSRTDYPKQFHDMLGTGQSLLQKTFSRINKLVPAENIRILTHQRYLDLTLQQLPMIGSSQVVLEPDMRNTAPCNLLAALKVRKENPDSIMLVAPSDHWIEDEEAYVKDVKACFDYAATHDDLMTIGIQPTFPNTGYGYIECQGFSNNEIAAVNQFREKPNYETAQSFVNSGRFMWNAGIFIWRSEIIAQAFKTFLPSMYALFESGESLLNTFKEEEFIKKNYSEAENISIDYGILEKAPNVVVKKANFDWNDLGTWGALYDRLEKRENDNAVVNATTIFRNAKENMVYTSAKKLVVLEDLKDYIVVDKEDVLLVYPKAKEQEIKQLLDEVRDKYGETYL